MELQGQEEKLKNNRELMKYVTDMSGFSPLNNAFIFEKYFFISDNNSFVYLWKNPKGKIYYSFNFLESKIYSASIATINSLLNEHFKFNFRLEVTNEHFQYIRTKKMLLNEIFRTNTQMYKLHRDIVTQNINSFQNNKIPPQADNHANDPKVGFIDNAILDTERDEEGVYTPIETESHQQSRSNTPVVHQEPVSVLTDTYGNVVAKWVGNGYLDIHYAKLYYNQMQNNFFDAQTNQVVLWGGQYSNTYIGSSGSQYTLQWLSPTDPRLNAINPQYTPQQALAQSNTGYNQQQIRLLDEKLQLNSQELLHNENTHYLSTEQIPTVHKEIFEPSVRMAFFKDKMNLLCKNKYTPSIYMVKNYALLSHASSTYNDSIILRFILAMTKNNLEKAENIFFWLARNFLTLQKHNVALVLYSKNDIFTNIFYKSIVEPLFNEEYCEEINNDTLNNKKRKNILDSKVIYHFKNIITTTFLNAPIKELCSSMLGCDSYMLYDKKITTKGNILISATSKHIPLISNDIRSIVVDVEDNIEPLCNELIGNNKFEFDKYSLAKSIKDDLDNFAMVLRNIDIMKLHDLNSNIKYYHKKSSNNSDTIATNEFEESILDGDAQVLEIFWLALVSKDRARFDKLKTTNKNSYDTLIGDFEKNRILGINLKTYFCAMFGENIYNTNRAILESSRGENLLDKYVKKHKIGSADYYNILEKYLDK